LLTIVCDLYTDRSMANHSTTQAAYHFRLRPEIRREVSRLNLSQSDLAKRLGITNGFLSQVLSGKRLVGPATRRKFMDVLHLEFDVLFEEVGEP